MKIEINDLMLFVYSRVKCNKIFRARNFKNFTWTKLRFYKFSFDLFKKTAKFYRLEVQKLLKNYLAQVQERIKNLTIPVKFLSQSQAS